MPLTTPLDQLRLGEAVTIDEWFGGGLDINSLLDKLNG